MIKKEDLIFFDKRSREALVYGGFLVPTALIILGGSVYRIGEHIGQEIFGSSGNVEQRVIERDKSPKEEKKVTTAPSSIPLDRTLKSMQRTQRPENNIYKISPEGIDFIKSYEKFRDHVYPDSAGKPTVGWGHLVKKGERFGNITEEEGERILRKDLEIAERAVRKCINVPLNQSQYDALVSIAYNAGIKSVSGSGLQKAVNSGNYSNVPDQMKRWVYANGMPSKGLKNRRNDEAEIWNGKNYNRNY